MIPGLPEIKTIIIAFFVGIASFFFIKRGSKQEGAQEEKQKQTEEILSDVKKAKTVHDFIDNLSDSAVTKRLQQWERDINNK